MTFVLESFVNRVGHSIERAYGLRPKGCWGLLKGSDRITDRRQAGFAPVEIRVPAGETAKSLKTIQACYDKLAQHRLERSSFIVALSVPIGPVRTPWTLFHCFVSMYVGTSFNAVTLLPNLSKRSFASLPLYS